MKRRTKIILIFGILVLAGATAFVLRPVDQNPPRLHIVRQGIEEGRQVVYFRVEGNCRRIQILDIERVIGDKLELSYLAFDAEIAGTPVPTERFWAPSMGLPVYLSEIVRKEFGINSPTNAPVWKLQILVAMAAPYDAERFEMMRASWITRRQMGCSFLNATLDALTDFYGRSHQIITSDPITNTIPPP